jgi:putative acetyltransferase
VIRREAPGEERAVRAVEAAAFGRTEEAELVDRLRAREQVVLSLVAAAGPEVIGHLLLTSVRIEGASVAARVLGLGPVAVRTEDQRRGVGSRLVRAAVEEARQLGAAGIVVLGHPAYYPRFGFVPARDFGLVTDYDPTGDAFFALELAPGALAGLRGRVRYAPEFDATGTDDRDHRPRR